MVFGDTVVLGSVFNLLGSCSPSRFGSGSGLSVQPRTRTENRTRKGNTNQEPRTRNRERHGSWCPSSVLSVVVRPERRILLLDGPPPPFVLLIPGHGVAQPGVECNLRIPAQAA